VIAGAPEPPDDWSDSWVEEPPADAAIALAALRDPDEPPLFGDVAAFLAGGMPPPITPVLLRREDGHHLFYAGKVNVLFGDPECGKTWIALAGVVEALNQGRRAAVIDLDHNGLPEIVGRLLDLGARAEALGDPDKFKLAEPEDESMLSDTVVALRIWRPAVVTVDSLGELLPLLRLSSNSPDDYTSAHRRVLTPLAKAGAVVVAIDHLPKSDDARTHGQTGTLAKRRAVNGVTLRVTVAETFAPGKGGSANMVVEKDRPGGVRAHCPVDGKRQPAGRFVMTPTPDGALSWKITTPKLVPVADQMTTDRMLSDIAELDGLVPAPSSKRDVQDRLKWGSDRAQRALSMWRDLRGHDE
jgi:hypothetical protein